MVGTVAAVVGCEPTTTTLTRPPSPVAAQQVAVPRKRALKICLSVSLFI